MNQHLCVSLFLGNLIQRTPSLESANTAFFDSLKIDFCSSVALPITKQPSYFCIHRNTHPQKARGRNLCFCCLHSKYCLCFCKTSSLGVSRIEGQLHISVSLCFFDSQGTAQATLNPAFCFSVIKGRGLFQSPEQAERGSPPLGHAIVPVGCDWFTWEPHFLGMTASGWPASRAAFHQKLMKRTVSPA